MVLFQVSTHFQLICAINVKVQMLSDVEADLHLDDTSDFSWVMDGLARSGLFRCIEQSEQVKKSIEIRKKFQESGKPFLKEIPEIWGFTCERPYTDVYFGHDMIPNKWYYYHLVERGIAPRVHILDEGMATYYKDIRAAARYDFINHSKYGDKSYFERLTEQMLFLPKGYLVKNPTWQVVQIPPINDQAKQVLTQIYGSYQGLIPKEKYIYLAAGGYEEGYFHNELDLVREIGNLVGKENLIIKQHPRHTLDIFSPFGYKVWKDESGVPWEIMLLENDTSQQVYLTLFSNAALSPATVLNRTQYTVYLYHLFLGADRHGLFGKSSKLSFSYLNRIKALLNAEQTYIFAPKTEKELREMIRYVDGMIQGGRNSGG